jgi:hypothetical protein
METCVWAESPFLGPTSAPAHISTTLQPAQLASPSTGPNSCCGSLHMGPGRQLAHIAPHLGHLLESLALRDPLDSCFLPNERTPSDCSKPR